MTTIAIFLIVLILLNIDIIPTAYAGSYTSGTDTGMGYGLVPMNPDGSINVHIKSADVLDVNIESCSMTEIMYAEPIKVEIDN